MDDLSAVFVRAWGRRRTDKPVSRGSLAQTLEELADQLQGALRGIQAAQEAIPLPSSATVAGDPELQESGEDFRREFARARWSSDSLHWPTVLMEQS